MILTNEAIASRLRTRAAELALGRENLYRVRAFRQAAMSVLMLPTPVADLLAKKGRAGLAELPGIGASLAETIEKLSVSGEDVSPLSPPGRGGEGQGKTSSIRSGCFGREALPSPPTPLPAGERGEIRVTAARN